MKQTVRLIKALAEETRLRIVALLAGGELCVCDLTNALKLPQSTVSRHLALLKNAGITADRKAGTWVYYRLDDSDPGIDHSFLPLLTKHLNQTERSTLDLANLKSYRESGQRTCS